MSDDFASMPRKRIGAGIVAVDDQMRVLLVEPTYKSNWEVPGGLVELGEPPREAAARECREELKSWLWCDREMLAEHLSDFMFRRMEAALEAIANGTVAELQNGYAAHSEVR